MEARRVAVPVRRSRSAGARGSGRCPHNDRRLNALRAAGLLAALVWTTALQAATVTSRNFIVHAPTEDVARQVAETAERCRQELAVAWLGKELPSWYRRCPIRVKVGQIGAGGATTFTFEGGEVFGWNMNVQGTLERILDSVIPHEVSHTIFASYFRRPLPRWADEGAATLVEHESERLRQTRLLNQVMRTSRRIPLQQLLQITEYPEDMQQVLTLYAEGYSLADFLVQQHGDEGRAVYLKFLADAHEHDWSYAFRKHYNFDDIREVEQHWTTWIADGSPPLKPEDGGTLIADAGAATQSPVPQAPAATPQTAQSSGADVRLSDAQAAPRRPQPPAPLPFIERQLRSRVSGSELDAPEPNTTAMPQWDVDPQSTVAVPKSGEVAVPASNSATPGAASGAASASFARDAATRPRQPRSSLDLPPAGSLRAINGGYDDAFQR